MNGYFTTLSMTVGLPVILTRKYKNPNSLPNVILSETKNPMEEITDLRIKGFFTMFGMTFGQHGLTY